MYVAARTRLRCSRDDSADVGLARSFPHSGTDRTATHTRSPGAGGTVRHTSPHPRHPQRVSGRGGAIFHRRIHERTHTQSLRHVQPLFQMEIPPFRSRPVRMRFCRHRALCPHRTDRRALFPAARNRPEERPVLFPLAARAERIVAHAIPP